MNIRMNIGVIGMKIEDDDEADTELDFELNME